MKKKVSVILLGLLSLTMGVTFLGNSLLGSNETDAIAEPTNATRASKSDAVEELLTQLKKKQLWKKVLKQNPNDAEALHQLGKSYARERKFKSAVKSYRQAIELNPDIQYLAYQDLGQALVMQGKTEDAIAAFRQGIQLGYPDAPKLMQEKEVFFRLGLTLHDANEMTEAVQAYEKTVSMIPGKISIHDQIIFQIMGEAFVKLDKLDEAKNSFERSLPNPRPITSRISLEDKSFLFLGRSLVREKRFEEAKIAFESFAKTWLASDIRSKKIALTHFASALALEGFHGKAIETYQESLSNSADEGPLFNSSAAKALMRLLIEKDQFEDAKVVSQKYLGSEIQYQALQAEHILKEAETSLKLGQYDTAERQCSQALSHFKRDINKVEALTCIGRAQFKLQKFENALESFRKAYKIYDFRYREVAMTLIELNRHDEAQRMYELNSSDEVTRAHQLGRAFLYAGKPELAVEHCKRSVALEPNLAESHLCLHSALTRLGRPDDAKVHLEKAFEIYQSRVSEIPDNFIPLAYEVTRLGNHLIPSRFRPNQGSREYLPSLWPINAYEGIGEAFELKGQYDEAIAAYRSALRLLPEDADLYLKLGQAQLRRNNTEVRSPLFGGQSRSDPRSHQLRNNIEV